MKTKIGTRVGYQPKTGEACNCRKGQERDNCPSCEGTGMRMDFKSIHERKLKSQHTPTPWRVEPLQADHGATIAIVGQYRNGPLVVAEIPPSISDENADMDTAKRHPCDESNAAFIVKAVNGYDSDQKKIKALVEVANTLYEELIKAHGKEWIGHHTASKYHKAIQQAGE